ncbi:hypothetical protein TARUN_6330 [Trichoderma arundinaceum]|uniref:Uncharacterized protein n=1 Tax=Trichoderma arundinaceum TaxID=490622 RepID=A0A395NJD4_TRIAR|nr:hypothetical protein TARUN_6330 [Trichoderma arundinaceum]
MERSALDAPQAEDAPLQPQHDVPINSEDEDERIASKKRLLEAETLRSSSPLENLPAELRHKLLMSMPDLPSLKAIVHASPLMHAQYLYSRGTILRSCLGRELGGLFVDAFATLKSRVSILGSPRTNGMIEGFLDSYNGWLFGLTRLSVATTGSSSVRKWALENLYTGTSHLLGEEKKKDVSLELQRSEEIRIFRAIYRCETFHHLFGNNRGRRRGAFRFNEVNEFFLCLFNPWEVEEIGCIDLFVRDNYEGLFNQVKADLSPSNTRFLQPNGILNPDGSVDISMECDDYIECIVSRGLRMLAHLFTIDDHDKLVVGMGRCITHDRCFDGSLQKALSNMAQGDRREMSPRFPNPQDEAQERGDPMEFTGDTTSAEGPPVAWVLLWNGRYANIYGNYVPIQLRKWGYVMWNEYRWKDMEAKELIRKQWEESPMEVELIEMDFNWSPLY